MVLSLIAHLLNGLLMIGLPLLLGIYLTRHFHFGWRIFFIGAATFVLSQVGHIPFNWVVNRLFIIGVIPMPAQSFMFYFNPIFGGLSAGLFEELTRAAVYRWWAKDARSWGKALLMGAGHEWAEAGIIGLLVLYALIQMVALRGQDLSKIVPPAQLALAQQQVAAYWSASIPMSLIGALERVLSIPCQIAFSVLVWKAYMSRRAYWVALAVLWHAVIDGVVIYLGQIWRGQSWTAYALEGAVGVFAILSLVIIFALRQPEPDPQPEFNLPPAPDQPVGGVHPEDVQEQLTSEKLNDSRYL